MHEISAPTKLPKRLRRASLTLLYAIVCAELFLSSPLAAAQGVCEIADVVYMTQRERLSSAKIRQECGTLRDGGSCTLTKVMRLASERLNESQIRDECQGGRSSRIPPQQQQQQQQQQVQQMPQLPPPALPRPASVCMTPFGSCPMMVALIPGSSCYCATPRGQFWGTAQ